MARKKAAKKAATKKVATQKKPALKAQKPTKGTAKKSSNQIIPKKLFAGKTICFAGRFGSYPTKKQMVDFAASEGGKVVPTPTADVDYLLLSSSGSAATVKKVAKLKADGADIQTINDFTQLFSLDNSDIVRLLCDASQLRRYIALPTFVVPHHTLLWHLSGEKFDGKVIGLSKDSMRLHAIEFHACSFKNATLQNVSAYFGGGFAGCQFDGTKLKKVSMGSVESCTFKGAVTDDANIGEVTESTFSKCNLGELGLGDAKRTKFVDCTLQSWQVGYQGRIHECSFTKCEINSSSFKDEQAWSHNEFNKTWFVDVTFGNGTHFSDSVFDGVEFKGCEFDDVVFEKCKFFNCKFINCTAGAIDFADSVISKVRAQGFRPEILRATPEQLKELKGIEADSASAVPLLHDLAKNIVAANEFTFSIEGNSADGKGLRVAGNQRWGFNVVCQNIESDERISQSTVRYNSITADKLTRALHVCLKKSQITSFDVASLRVKSKKCPLRSPDLKKLLFIAFYEAIGQEPQSEEEIKAAEQQSRETTKKLRQRLANELAAGKVAKFNRTTKLERERASPLKKLDLTGVSLPKLNASGMEFVDCKFDDCNLSDAKLTYGRIRKSSFVGAKLDGANLKEAYLTAVNLQRASLKEAMLNLSEWKDVVFAKSDLSKATLTGSNLCGADLSQAKLTGAKLIRASYDEKTRFPKSTKVADLKKMQWYGDGIPPHERKQNKEVSGPIDFEQFMARLKEITDASRLSKSTKMLKKDAFQLFSEVTDDSVYGVVKSQTDADLVYSCSLSSEGAFACCTQNLNACGGLRGALCKHILVLVVGLAKGGELDPTLVDEWINNSKLKGPQLDKDRMSEVLLKYKGAEAGEIDWRPTETVPEDFFAF